MFHMYLRKSESCRLHLFGNLQLNVLDTMFRMIQKLATMLLSLYSFCESFLHCLSKLIKKTFQINHNTIFSGNQEYLAFKILCHFLQQALDRR